MSDIVSINWQLLVISISIIVIGIFGLTYWKFRFRIFAKLIYALTLVSTYSCVYSVYAFVLYLSGSMNDMLKIIPLVLISLTMIGGLAYFLNSRMIRPLTDIVEKSQELAKGNFSISYKNIREGTK